MSWIRLRSLLNRNWHVTFTSFVVGGDGYIFLFSAYVSYVLVAPLYLDKHAAFSPFFKLIVLLYGTFLFFSILFGLYRYSYLSSYKNQVYTLVKTYISIALVITPASFLFWNVFYLQVFIVVSMFLTWFLLFVSRAWIPNIMAFFSKHNIGIHRAFVIIEDDAPDFVNLVSYLDQIGYRIIHTFYVGKDNFEEKISDSLKQGQISIIFICCYKLNGKKFSILPRLCSHYNVKLKIITPLSKNLLSSIKIHDITGIPLVIPRKYKIEVIKKVLKRGFDIVGALFFLLLTSPLFLLLAILIKLESEGPVFFAHIRGLSPHGRKFKFYKFRSMVNNGDVLKAHLVDETTTSGALFKMKKDPRITKVGKIMRRFSLDELPQFFNVLKGDMSLVGPRPLPINDYKMISGTDVFCEFYHLRSEVKPGMTGLWQISRRSHLSFEEMVLLDLYYVENHNIFLDIQVIVSTIPVMIFGGGAY